jgi:transcriptional regulator with XRE-family HTH domain
MNQFTELLNNYIKKMGLTDEALAKQMQVSKMTVYNWRTGKIQQPASCQKVLKCAELLELSIKQRLEFLKAAGHFSGKDEQLSAPIPVIGLPIIQPYQFFGRENILHQIYLAWDKPVPESLIILGPKRSGKTSLLNYLKQITQATYLRPEQPEGWPTNWLPKHFQFAFVDFQDANMYQLDTLLKDVLQQLNLTVPENCQMADFSSIIKRECNQPTVILIDNMRRGLSAPTLEEAFWQNLCALGSTGKLSFVVSCVEQLDQLEQQYQDKLFPFLNLFGHILNLKEFTESEARNLLAASPKPFTEEEIEVLLKESGCWPEPLQKLCHERLL